MKITLQSRLKGLLLMISTALVLMQCTNQPEITEQDVSRIIRTLSADSMKGRNAFSAEIGQAVAFIAEEFEKAGLKPLPGLDNYLQKFEVCSITEDISSVQLNNTVIPEERYFALLDRESFEWNQDSGIQVFHISKDDHFKSKFREYRSDTLESLIIVDESHLDLFYRFRHYFSRPSRMFKPGEGYNDVFAVYDGDPSAFHISFNNSVDRFELSNVAGMVEGRRTDEIVLFSAHYDHIGMLSPVDGDSIANGANDNASGVTGIIELANYFSNKSKPQRTLYFVAFTAEESGGYGSKYFSRSVNPEHIVAMFNLEMIGKPYIEGPNSAWITGFERSSFGRILQKNVEDTEYEFFADPYPKQNLFYRSDNATLARLGVPAHSISTTPIDIDKDYHTVSDEYETIHISHLTNTINAIAKASESIISGKDTPTRVNVNLLD